MNPKFCLWRTRVESGAKNPVFTGLARKIRLTKRR
jgi:hypothetical protein